MEVTAITLSPILTTIKERWFHQDLLQDCFANDSSLILEERRPGICTEVTTQTGDKRLGPTDNCTGRTMPSKSGGLNFCTVTALDSDKHLLCGKTFGSRSNLTS